MRTLTTLLCLSLFTAPVAFAQIVGSKQGIGTSGSIKSIEIWNISFSMKDGKPVPGGRTRSQLTTFRPDGNKDEVISYLPDGSISDRFVYTYDARGRNTGYNEYVRVLDETLTTFRKHNYELDDQGRKIKYTVIEADGEVADRFTYRYDSKGNMIEQTVYPSGKLVRTYDDEGRWTSDVNYEGEAQVSSFQIEYDPAGDRSETRQYFGNRLNSRVIYACDAKHRVISQETFVYKEPTRIQIIDGRAVQDLPLSHEPKPGKIITGYDDSAGTKEISEYNSAGVLQQRVLDGFDEKEQQISSAMFDGNGKSNDPIRYFYDGNRLQGTLQGPLIIRRESDSHGNLVKTTFLIKPAGGGEPQAYKIEERVITYY